MSKNLNNKQVSNVTRRKWDIETYEKKALAREQEAQLLASNGADGDYSRRKIATSNHGQSTGNNRELGDNHDEKEEFRRAKADAKGPEGSKRAFLKARTEQVEIDSKVGTTELISVEQATATKSKSLYETVIGEAISRDSYVVKTGIGWYCKVCDCYLKDSLTYLDHINGRKHQRNLGYSMRVERSTKDQLQEKLSQLTRQKQDQDLMESSLDTSFDEIVKAKDEELRRRKEERRKRRKERKKQKAEPEEIKEEAKEDEEDAECVEGGVDPALAAMMGFSGFGGSKK